MSLTKVLRVKKVCLYSCCPLYNCIVYLPFNCPNLRVSDKKTNIFFSDSLVDLRGHIIIANVIKNVMQTCHLFVSTCIYVSK